MTWGSCGDPRASPRPRPGVLGDVAGPRRPRGRPRRRPVLAVGAVAGRPGGRARPLVAPAPALPPHRRGDRRGGAQRAGHRHRAALRRRVVRRRVLASFGALQFVADIDDAASPRPRGCCDRAAGSPSRSRTRRAGPSPTTPTRPGLTATQSYWDRTPYVEVDDETGVVSYVEHHRTLSDWVERARRPRLRRSPTCSSRSGREDHDRVWGGWSRTRGRLTPGTASSAPT